MSDILTTIGQGALCVLNTSDTLNKVKAARKVARMWRCGELAHEFDTELPDEPARPDTPELLPPNKMPRRGKGSLHGRIALLHALAHIEFSAIDLAFDLVGRFGTLFPREFVDDWISVGADEAMHFALLDRRLKNMGSYYGALPAHADLWESAYDTRNDALARLAIVPMVLEARGLDITPATVERFENQGDLPSANILNRIYHDEIRHVWFGTRWFEYRCQAANLDRHSTWQTLVNLHFKGKLKRPFNNSARTTAGLTQDYYLALVK